MKALFIGLGSIGQRHLRNLISRDPSVELIAVRRIKKAPTLSDSNQVMKRTLDETYKLKVFDSIESCIELKPDLAIVSSPSALHFQDSLPLIQAKIPCLIEKPLTTDLNDARRLISEEEKSGKRLIYPVFQYRYNKALNKCKKIVEAGKIGNVVSARFINGEYIPHWHKYEEYSSSYAAVKDLGGGALYTQIHDIDYLQWMLGEVMSVSCTGGKLSNLKLEVEDSVQLSLEVKMRSNSTIIPVFVSLDYLTYPPKRELSIVGDKGSLFCDLLQNKISYICHTSNSKEMNYDYSAQTRNKMFEEMMDEFINSVESGTKFSVDINGVLKSLKVVEAAHESLANDSIRVLL